MPPRNQNTAKIGHSSGNGYTGRAETHLPPTDISHLVPCILHKEAKYSEIFVEFGVLADKIKKYGERLVVPKRFLKMLQPKPVAVASPVQIGTTATGNGNNSKPVLDLTTGRYYHSAVKAALALGCTEQVIRSAVKSETLRAKGHRLRFATIDEQTAFAMNPKWQYRGTLIPITGRFASK